MMKLMSLNDEAINYFNSMACILHESDLVGMHHAGKMRCQCPQS